MRALAKKIANICICAKFAHIQILFDTDLVEKDHIFRAFRHFIRPIIRFLLRHGVTWNEYSELSKDMYVEVARQGYGLQGRPTNNSRVALMTGLSRREVARIRDRLLDEVEDPANRSGNRISQILTGWHVDQEFSDGKGHPKELPPDGNTGSMESLLQRYAGDLPHSAVTKEMQQRGLIEITGDGNLRALKRDYTYMALDPEIVQQMSVSLHDHAATLDHNLNQKRETARRFEGIADNTRISSRSARTFMKLVETRGMDFLEEIDGWLSANEIDEQKSTSGREIRMGVGVYLIYDDV